MHIKFLDHGTGSAVAAAEYLTQEHDHKGDKREEIEIMRGDPFATGRLADDLSFRQKYSSAVISWSPDDKPTPEQMQETLDLFEQTAFAGLDKDRYSFAAVRHDDHIHVIAARVDLATGKSYNIAPPGWESRYDPLRDHLNYRHDWCRPDDPNRSRAVGFTRNGTQKENKAALDNFLTNCVALGEVKNRDDLIKKASTVGLSVNRQTDNSITFKESDSNQKYKLTGGIYERDFNAATATYSKSPGRNCGVSEKEAGIRAGAAFERLQASIKRTTEYNDKRYQQRNYELERRTDTLEKNNREIEQSIRKISDRVIQDKSKQHSYDTSINYDSRTDNMHDSNIYKQYDSRSEKSITDAKQSNNLQRDKRRSVYISPAQIDNNRLPERPMSESPARLNYIYVKYQQVKELAREYYKKAREALARKEREQEAKKRAESDLQPRRDVFQQKTSNTMSEEQQRKMDEMTRQIEQRQKRERERQKQKGPELGFDM